METVQFNSGELYRHFLDPMAFGTDLTAQFSHQHTYTQHPAAAERLSVVTQTKDISFPTM